ncbi:ABC transporter substrate-binding protein [Amycolatopsis alkalitolerans]|uniref:ABC transporter substrate-binding protein n=1 Tax=Amycolatopsis alkalitolerans TaxID=2547244 RepID=UPI00135BB837|nr:ABC transporter substrate-binding protein [Amycolatopsis alkalitolerans]
MTNESIIHMNPDGSLGPGLATSWRYVGSDNTDFEFTLRDDARFSDGTSVNADAVKRWLEYFPSAHGPAASYMALKSIKTVGEWTVQLDLSSPNPDVPVLLSEAFHWGAVSSPKAVADPSVLGTRTFGGGQYTVDPAASVTGSKYTLVPNKFYYDPSRIRFSKVVVEVIENPSSRLAAIGSGQLDVAFGDQATAAQAKTAAMNVLTVPYGTGGLVITDRVGKLAKPLGDVRVRQALNYALDRDAITTGLFGEAATPTSVYLTINGFDPSDRNHYPYDPEMAKSLLAAAGYPSGFTVKVLVAGVAGQYGLALAQAIGKYLAAVGVKLDIKTAATGGEFQQMLPTFPVLAGGGPANPMTQIYAAFFSQGGPGNPFNFNSSALDTLYQQAITAPADKTSQYWRQMSQEIARQAYFVPVVEQEMFWYSSKNVHGVAANMRSLYPFATEWSLG